jgi:cell division protein YceG involved in septum cleavage
VAHLTKLAAQKRDDAIEKAGKELKKAVTMASIIRRKEEATAQSARAKADEKVCLFFPALYSLLEE